MPTDISFRDYRQGGEVWLTLANGEYYPDILIDACNLYTPVLVEFGIVLRGAHSSQDFYRQIMATREQWMRTQLCRVFKKYVSPQTPVEMLKRKQQTEVTIQQFGANFRPISEVQSQFSTRPISDEVMCALLWEYKDRGKKGYDLTERLFELLKSQHPDIEIVGPQRAGKDVLLGSVFENYPKADRPVDFILKRDDEILAVGLARYDSDRGGSQEDDRTGQYREVAHEVISYANSVGLDKMKVIFINDGPGLLLGTMWNDYSYLEESWGGRVKVATLRMVPERLSIDWLLS